MVTKYHTLSGSTYEVDHINCRVRKVKTGVGSNTKRAVEEWRDFERIEGTVGTSLYICWGAGRDAVSDELGTPPDVQPLRMTITSRIESVEAVQ